MVKPLATCTSVAVGDGTFSQISVSSVCVDIDNTRSSLLFLSFLIFLFEEEAEVTQSEIRKPSFHVEDQFDQKQKQKQKHDRSTAIASSQSQFERGFNEKEPGQRTAAWD